MFIYAILWMFLHSDSCKSYYDDVLKTTVFVSVENQPIVEDVGTLIMKKYSINNSKYFNSRVYVEFIVDTFGCVKELRINKKNMLELEDYERGLYEIISNIQVKDIGMCDNQKVIYKYKSFINLDMDR